MRQGFCYFPLAVDDCQKLCSDVLNDDGYQLTVFGIGGRRVLCAKPLNQQMNSYVAMELVFEAMSQTETRIRVNLKGSSDMTGIIPVVLPHLLKHLKTAVEARAFVTSGLAFGSCQVSLW